MPNEIFSRIPSAQLKEDCPREDHLSIRILEQPNSAKLRIELAIPLSRDIREEHAVIDELQLGENNPNLDIQYDLHFDFDAECEIIEKDIEKLINSIRSIGSPRGNKLKINQLNNEYNAHLRSISDKGSSVFRRLFVDRSLDLIYEELSNSQRPLALRAVQSAFRRSHLIDIKSPRPLYPWAWLYNDPRNIERMDSAIQTDPRYFWGMHHQISEVVHGVSRRTRIAKDRSPAIAAAICPSEFKDFKVDVKKSLQRYFGDADLINQSNIKVISDVTALTETLLECQADIIYFLGHADHFHRDNSDEPEVGYRRGKPTPTTSWVMMQGFKLSVESVTRIGPIKYNQNPTLVFLNGCNTSPIRAWNDQSFAGMLCLSSEAMSHACCLLTTASVPASFAREYGALVWKRALAGESLGRAIRGARLDMLTSYENPLGLMYSFLGRLETRIG